MGARIECVRGEVGSEDQGEVMARRLFQLFLDLGLGSHGGEMRTVQRCMRIVGYDGSKARLP